MKHASGNQSSISIAMTPDNRAPELVRDESGLLRSGDIAISVIDGRPPMFVWSDAIAYGLMVDTSLAGDGRTIWEVHSTVGFSTSVLFGHIPDFAEEICNASPLVPGRRYFVSVYGSYPRYGIQEFIA
jgi:hypothetical protein